MRMARRLTRAQKMQLAATGEDPTAYLAVKTRDGRILFQHRETGEILNAKKKEANSK